jgi:hypothetical protein
MAFLTFSNAATSLADHSRYPTAPINVALGLQPACRNPFLQCDLVDSSSFGSLSRC